MDQNVNKPNLKYGHAYPIIRADSMPIGTEIENAIKVVKIVQTQQRAEEEVDRLNELNKDKEMKYFYDISRVEE